MKIEGRVAELNFFNGETFYIGLDCDGLWRLSVKKEDVLYDLPVIKAARSEISVIDFLYSAIWSIRDFSKIAYQSENELKGTRRI